MQVINSKNKLKKLARIIFLLSAVVFVLASYYFTQPDPKHICRSGCESHFSLLIATFKEFGGVFPPSVDTNSRLTLEEVAESNFCPTYCFRAKHPLAYVFFDLFIVLFAIGVILTIVSKILKNMN